MDDEQLLKEEINQMILETLTISDEVFALSDHATNIINQQLSTEINQKRSQNQNAKQLSGDFNFILPATLDNKTWKITTFVHYEWFKDEKTVKKLNIEMPTHLDANSMVRIEKRISIISLRLVIPIIGNKTVGMFSMAIQHELNHIYQQIKMGHTYAGIQQYRDNVSDMYHHEDESVRTISTLLYRLLPNEQDAFVNGLYNEVKQKCSENPEAIIDEVIKSTQTYTFLSWCRRTLSDIEKNPDRFIDTIKQRGYGQMDTFLKKMNLLLKRYQSKVAHCIIRLKNDHYGVLEGYVRFNFGSLTENLKRGYPLFLPTYRLY